MNIKEQNISLLLFVVILGLGECVSDDEPVLIEYAAFSKETLKTVMEVYNIFDRQYHKYRSQNVIALTNRRLQWKKNRIRYCIDPRLFPGIETFGEDAMLQILYANEEDGAAMLNDRAKVLSDGTKILENNTRVLRGGTTILPNETTQAPKSTPVLVVLLLKYLIIKYGRLFAEGSRVFYQDGNSNAAKDCVDLSNYLHFFGKEITNNFSMKLRGIYWGNLKLNEVFQEMESYLLIFETGTKDAMHNRYYASMSPEVPESPRTHEIPDEDETAKLKNEAKYKLNSFFTQLLVGTNDIQEVEDIREMKKRLWASAGNLLKITKQSQFNLFKFCASCILSENEGINEQFKNGDKNRCHIVEVLRAIEREKAKTHLNEEEILNTEVGLSPSTLIAKINYDKKKQPFVQFVKA